MTGPREDTITHLFPTAELSRTIPLSQLGTAPAHQTIHASDDEMRALAVRLKITAIRDIQGLLAVRMTSDHQRVLVEGNVSATIIQPCVVTLEPVETSINEKIDLVFATQTPEQWPDEIDVAEADDEWPEPLRGDVIDLGEIAVQAISLGIPDYPRRDGVVFDPDSVAGAERLSPFSVLRDLKKSPE